MSDFINMPTEFNQSKDPIIIALLYIHEGNRAIFNQLVDLKDAINTSAENRSEDIDKIISTTFSVVR